MANINYRLVNMIIQVFEAFLKDVMVTEEARLKEEANQA